MTKVSAHLGSALIGAIVAGGLIIGTAAVVRADPAVPNKPIIVAPQTTGVPAAVKAAIDAMKPVQLPTWSTSLPSVFANTPCVEGEMGMIMSSAPASTTVSATIPARLVVCVATSSGACAQVGTKPRTSCFASDAACTSSGGTPAGGSSANGVSCPNSNYARACNGTVSYCAQFGGTYSTKWQQVTLTNLAPGL